VFCSFSLLAHPSAALRTSENGTKRKGTFRQVFFKEILSNLFKNHILKAKFPPRLQKFLTLLKYYTYEKVF
jgi:hypothetical protein